MTLSFAGVARAVPAGPAGYRPVTMCAPRASERTADLTERIRNDIYTPAHYRQCVTPYRTGFKVTTQSGWGHAYPSLQYGVNMFGVGTGDYRPVRFRRVADLVLSVRTRFAARPGAKAADAADIWFTDGHQGQAANRAELMVWLKWQSLPEHPDHMFRMCRQRWSITWWTTRHAGDRWHYIQLRDWTTNARRAPMLHDCDLAPALAVLRSGRHHWGVNTGPAIEGSWWLTSLDWGTESWHGVTGVAAWDWRPVVVLRHVKPRQRPTASGLCGTP